MQVTVIGLGKMGLNLTKQLLDQGHTVQGYDVEKSIYQNYSHPSLTYLEAINDIQNQPSPRTVFSLLPAGVITQESLKELSLILNEGDKVIDFSNSNYKDSIQQAGILMEQGIQYFDCGLSGGVQGARHGACMMLGGREFASEELLDLLASLCQPLAFQAYEGIGSGHYLKMVHNGIEYGMMQSIAEGLELLKEQGQFDFDLSAVTQNWEQGSIIESALLSNIHQELVKDASLSGYSNQVHASGEAKWMVVEAMKEEVAVPTIALSLMKRNASLKDLNFSNQVLSAMRYNFGGHRNN